MPRFLVVSDDQHKAFFNVESICMFRVLKADHGRIAEPLEIEVEFIGGTKTKLIGDPAQHFLSAVGMCVNP